MALSYREFELNEAAIEAASSTVQDYLNALNMERQNVQRIRLTVEELLLNLLNGPGRGIAVRMGIGRQFGRHILRLQYGGASFDPTGGGGGAWSGQLLTTLGYSPAWDYARRTNTVSLVLQERARRSAIFYIGVAVAAAALLGITGIRWPEAVRQELGEAILQPVSGGFLGLMKTFAGLMIAFTICDGVLGFGDTVALGRMGKRVLGRFIGVSFAVCAATGALVLPFLRAGASAGARQGSQLGSITRMLVDILPSNPITSFQEGNSMQIIVIALFTGVGLLAIGERGGLMRRFISEGTTLTQRIVSAICGFVPVFVFAMLLNQIWTGQAGTLLVIWKPLVLIISSEIILVAALWLLTSLRLKCPPLRLLRKVLPPFVVAFTTASSMSAMTLGMDTCKRSLGVKGRLVSFAYPLGSVIYMPASIASFMAIVCSFTEIYQVAVTPAWVVMAVITVTLLVIAMPPIPGAGLMVYTILFARLGIPSDALILATAIDVMVDFCNTGFNVLLLILQIAGSANALGGIDRARLMGEG